MNVFWRFCLFQRWFRVFWFPQAVQKHMLSEVKTWITVWWQTVSGIVVPKIIKIWSSAFKLWSINFGVFFMPHSVFSKMLRLNNSNSSMNYEQIYLKTKIAKHLWQVSTTHSKSNCALTVTDIILVTYLLTDTKSKYKHWDLPVMRDKTVGVLQNKKLPQSASKATDSNNKHTKLTTTTTGITAVKHVSQYVIKCW